MPIRFRRSFKIFPGVRSTSVRVASAFRLASRGRPLTSVITVRQTIGLPGSGVSQTSYLFKSDSKSDKENNKDDEDKDDNRHRARASEDDVEEEQEIGCFPGGCVFTTVLLAIALYIVAYNLHWIPQTFLTDVLQVITQWLRELGL